MAPEERQHVIPDLDPDEIKEWLRAFDDVHERYGRQGASLFLTVLNQTAYRMGISPHFTANTPYLNTIHIDDQPRMPGSREIERRIKSIIRWNAMAMVVRANREHSGIGGHISTFASAATLFEVGFNHFFKGKDADGGGDTIYFQGHASPGVYARAFLEGRLTEKHLKNFRRETQPDDGLSSYPHPWLMPGFWEFPSVSMGLAPIMAIYQARFNRYLHDRGVKDTSKNHVWCLMGDGETDEPESLGAITLASREQLDNLIFVINCNLQRLDGPVRGNGKIIQELEAVFRGAGWNVIKVIWGDDWDPLLAKDKDGLLAARMMEVVDGEYQKYTVSDGRYIREHFFGKFPELKEMVDHLSDEQVWKLRRGGHDPAKVYAAYKYAVEHRGSPTVILAKTVKGYGLGEAGEGKNITHQQKKLNEEELRHFRSRFSIPISDQEIADAPFYKPSEDSEEIQYLHERRKELGGYIPHRKDRAPKLDAPPLDDFSDFLGDSGGREVSTTMTFVRMFGRLLQHKTIGKLLVPIVPDESRTFGMEALFRQVGIHSHVGQMYEPVDRDTLLYYKETKDGQILEEGITEAGSLCSFIAAGTAYATHGVNTIPFFIYYSMFGYQRVGDLIWAAGDSRAKGFLLGGTAGRTTLAGEGLQHQDGHSHVLAAVVPPLVAYDPAYGYEIAVIIQDGIRRMFQEKENLFYYLTLYNENYEMAAMPDGSRDGILRGMYRFRSLDIKNPKGRVQLFGSGSILREALKAQEILADRYQVASDVWSVTSYKQLRADALEVEHWNRLHPSEEPRRSYLEETVAEMEGPIVAATDYMKLVPDQIRPWVPGGLVSLGTDGYGRSDTRQDLRRHFEVNAVSIAFAALFELARRETIDRETVNKALKDLEIDPDKPNPVTA